MGSEIMWGKWYTPKVRILSHLLFWVIVSFLYYLAYKRLVGQYFWLFAFKDLIVTASLFYSANWVIPNWVSKGKIIASLLFIVFAYFWWASCTYLDCRIASEIIPISETKIHGYLNFFIKDGYLGVFYIKKFPDLILDFLFLISLPLAPKLTKVIFEDANKLAILERDKASLERDNLQMELDILKSQISPHFVFNTLNSIYRMAEVHDPNTPNSILNLSNLLRYILYQTEDEQTYISREIQFLKDYLNLMKLRYRERVRIEINVEEIEEPYQIVPLILIPFVENAIKHGPDRSRKDSWVKVDIKIDNGALRYTVANSVDNMAGDHRDGGIGLQNIKRRLEIYYHGRYSLDIDQGNDSYTIFLEIKL